MKTHTIVALGLFFVIATAAQAQERHESPEPSVTGPKYSYQQPQLENIARNYLRCLNADNPGVVESALGHITYMRIVYPKLDLREIEQAVFKLTMTGTSRSIRSKAFLALRVFADPSAYRKVLASGEENAYRLFEDIAGRMMP